MQGVAEWLGPIQAWIEGVCNEGRFVVSHDAGVKRDLDHWEGNGRLDRPSSDVYTGLAALFAAVGHPYSDWRAYTTHPDDAGANLSRPAAAGDIIGWWIFEDLVMALRGLLFFSPVYMAWYGEANGQNSGEGEDWTWADAKTAAEADWDGGGNLGLGGQPIAWSYGQQEVVYGFFIARIRRLIGKGMLYTQPIPTVTKDIAWYVYAQAAWTWDAMGDNVVQDQWHNWLTDEGLAGAATEYSSASLGAAVSKPTWVDEPAVQGVGEALDWGADEGPDPGGLTGIDAVVGFDFVYQ